MPVIPRLQQLLDSLPKTVIDFSDVAAQRAIGINASASLADIVAEPGPALRDIDTVTVPVEDGTINVRIYQPDTTGPHPLHVYYHGGGWAFGGIDDAFTDIVGRERAALAGYVTATVDYRLAPEAKFPTPLDDAYAALVWLVGHAADHDIDPHRITVGGASAGANLAAAVALRARDEDGPRIGLQVLEIPALDLSGSSPSYQTYGGGDYPIPMAEFTACVNAYVRDAADIANPYVSPLMAPDLTGLPPALVMSAEYDPVSDDGSRYAARLRDADVQATFRLGHGHVHGSSAFTKLLPEAARWRDDVVTALRAYAVGAAA